MKWDLLTILVKIEVATGKDDFGSTLHVDSTIITVFSYTAVVNN